MIRQNTEPETRRGGRRTERPALGVAVGIAVLAVLLATPSLAMSQAPPSPNPGDTVMTVTKVEFAGQVVVPTGTVFDDTEIGGLSSITYDERRGVYYTISDDQGNRPGGDPVRYYTVAIDLTDGTLDDGDLVFTDTTTLLDGTGQPYAPGGLDPEGLAMVGPGRFFVSSEGNTLADPIIQPFIRRYNRDGRVTAELPVPEYYRPNGTDRGFRFNLGFESLNVTPDRKHLVTAGEAALAQDGPAATFDNGSLARILVYDVARREPISEFVYEVDPWAEPSAVFGVNGIVEVLPVDNAGTILVMERSFSVGGVLGGGTGNVVLINEISTAGATDTLGIDALYENGAPVAVTPVSERLVFAFDDLGLPIDNIEGMTWGRRCPTAAAVW
jgi:hypothetical protein